MNENGIALDDTPTLKEIIAQELGYSLEKQRISKAELARRMHTCRSQVDRLLDPCRESVNLQTIERAFNSIGKTLTVRARNITTRKKEKSNKARRPWRLLDLFCCAGGAGYGYHLAGFEVVGVDVTPQPRYPFEFIQADALSLDPDFLLSFDAIHASPPCQSYSDLAKRNGNADAWPRLIEPVREALINSGLPYVIENVEGAPLIDPVVLCGTMFPGLRVLRHRLFETNFQIITPPHGKHPKVHTFDKRKAHYGRTDEWIDFVQVTGGGNCSLAAARDAMGIDWMTKNEINESIPPAYTQLIGEQLILHLVHQQGKR